VQHGKGKEARLRAGEHPQGLALLALPCHATRGVLGVGG
jgi:hypothetical protein